MTLLERLELQHRKKCRAPVFEFLRGGVSATVFADPQYDGMVEVVVETDDAGKRAEAGKIYLSIRRWPPLLEFFAKMAETVEVEPE